MYSYTFNVLVELEKKLGTLINVIDDDNEWWTGTDLEGESHDIYKVLSWLCTSVCNLNYLRIYWIKWLCSIYRIKLSCTNYSLGIIQKKSGEQQKATIHADGVQTSSKCSCRRQEHGTWKQSIFWKTWVFHGSDDSSQANHKSFLFKTWKN